MLSNAWKYVKDSKTLPDTTKPKDFTGDVLYVDWRPTLVNHLQQIPGIHGIPLSYIVSENDILDHTPTVDFIAAYIQGAPLTGTAYESDNSQVASS